MAEEYSFVYMYHIFFIHSSVSGRLGGFQVLAIVNSAAVNMGVHVYDDFSFSFFFFEFYLFFIQQVLISYHFYTY